MPKQNYDYSTGQDIVDEHRRIVADDGDTSIDAEQDDSLLYILNLLKREVINMPFAGLNIGPHFIQPTRRAWDFMEDDKPFSFIAKTALAADITAGATTTTIDSGTGWDSTNGAFVTYDANGTYERLTFTTRSSGSITGMSAAGIDHDDGDDAEKLYALPADFGRPLKLLVAGQEYTQTEDQPLTEQFSVWNGFLWVPRNLGVTSGTLKYAMKATDLVTLDSTMDTPKELDPYFIERLNARNYRNNGNPQADIERAERAAASHLSSFLVYTTHSSNQRVTLVRGPISSPTTTCPPVVWPNR